MLISANAHAIRTLQLDILGGTYDSLTQTVIGGETGTLFAYGCLSGNCDGALDLSQSYYISMAVLPNDGIGEDTDFGSFTFAGMTYDYTNTVFGAPPLESGVVTQLFEAGDLAKHDVFNTAFGEHRFDFDSLVEGVADNTRSSVDTQNDPGTDPLANIGNNLAYVGFNYDTTGLLDGYTLHFDLYSAELKICVRENGGCTTGDVDITDFAAFSHDAGTTCCTTDLPEPNSLGIALLGAVGMVFARARRRRVH
jgi:hypothetical protein